MGSAKKVKVMTGKNISGDKYMTRQETAEYLKISIRSVDRLIHDKHFDGIQYIGRNVRVHKPTLDRYLEQRRGSK